MPTVETFDNTDSSGGDVTTQAFAIDGDINKVVKWLTTVQNGWDVSVDVTAEVTTSDDSGFSKSITDAGIASADTISSGNDAFYEDTNDTPWSYVRFTLSPGGDPTSGSVTVTFQRRRLGGD